MSKFKLICEDGTNTITGAIKIKHEFETEELNDILVNMTNFLQLSGFLDKNKRLSFERQVIFDDLDEFTEKLFTGQHANETINVNGGQDVISLNGTKYSVVSVNHDKNK
jgi:hypothetical protein